MRFLKNGIKIVILLCFSFCASQNEFESHFPVEIDSVYFQKDKADSTKKYFHVVFKKNLPDFVQLKKVHFKNYESMMRQVYKKEFVVLFSDSFPKQDLILDKDSKLEYGNKVPVITKPKFILDSNEVVLEYSIKNKTYFFKIVNIKER